MEAAQVPEPPLEYSCQTHIRLEIKPLRPGGLPGGTVAKNLPANAGDARDSGLIPGSGRFPWRRKWQPIRVVVPGKFLGQKSLAGYSSCKESDITERQHINTSRPSLCINTTQLLPLIYLMITMHSWHY